MNIIVLISGYGSNLKAIIDYFKQKNLPKNYPSVWFGQLYGMSEHITFNLAENGYNVVKLIPFVAKPPKAL